MTATSKSSTATKRTPTLGQRVPAEVQKKFNDYAQKKLKCTAADLLRALMEATYSGETVGGKKDLHVRVTVGKVVSASDVMSRLDEILTRLPVGNDRVDQLVIEHEPDENFAAVFEESPAETAPQPTRESPVLQEAIPARTMNIDPNGWLILKTKFGDRDEVVNLGATRRDAPDGKFLAWVVSPKLKDKFDLFARWF